MTAFNPNTEQHFCGQDSLHFFTDLAPRSVKLYELANSVHDQGGQNSCTGRATDTALDIFSAYRGQSLNLSWAFAYYIARRMENGSLFNNNDTGVQWCSTMFKAVNKYGICLQSFTEGYGVYDTPTDAAFADAETRKLEVFERIDLFDTKNAIITALAHGIPIAAKFSISRNFGTDSDDPYAQMASFNYPGVRLNEAHPDFYGYHFMAITGYDLDMDCAYVTQSWGNAFGKNGTMAMRWETLLAQLWEAFVPREFAGMTSYVDPKWIVKRNERHNSAYMLNLRKYMYKILTLPEAQYPTWKKARVTRDNMPLLDCTAQDLADAAAPWGVSLPIVESFLATPEQPE